MIAPYECFCHNLTMENKTILIVEDDLILLESIANEVASHGVAVVKTSTVDSAKNELLSQEPDLILLDLLLPTQSGYALLEYIKANNLTVPVIIISNLSDNFNIEQCTEMGAVDYLVKSNIDQDEIWQKIEKWLTA